MTNRTRTGGTVGVHNFFLIRGLFLADAKSTTSYFLRPTFLSPIKLTILSSISSPLLSSMGGSASANWNLVLRIVAGYHLKVCVGLVE